VNHGGKGKGTGEAEQKKWGETQLEQPPQGERTGVASAGRVGGNR